MTANHKKILIVNPNSSTAVTESIKSIISHLSYPNVSIAYYTSSPTSPSLLRSQEDLDQSHQVCIHPLLDLAPEYDGILIACYADHPLTRDLQSRIAQSHLKRSDNSAVRPVVEGIFDASITVALQSQTNTQKLISELRLGQGEEVEGVEGLSRFGILTTGESFVDNLTSGVERILQGYNYNCGDDDDTWRGVPHNICFGGVVASGVGVEDLQEDDESRFRMRMKVVQATRRLVKEYGVKTICVGGVILAGEEVRKWILEALERESLDNDDGMQLRIVDQMDAGMKVLCERIFKG
ncbi:hypothetical protein F5884DRAFT_778311 [Xylogone sp. PMI_703]|nr:hypothetical protein F5884DRAFT_778311 [Xylogone sp. PMI_703]